MTDVLSFVLNGLEDYLELERELGKRTIIESSNNRIIELLGDLRGDATAAGATRETGASRGTRGIGASALAVEATRETGATRETRGIGASDMSDGRGERPASPSKVEAVSHRFENESNILSFAFIHDRPLSPKAVEMMSKIIVALGQTTESAPIAVAPPLPKARFYVFLGNRALQKYLPGVRAEENHWFKTPKGLDALFVRSPEDIVRFATVTPALQKIKQAMWLALKTISQRLRAAAEADAGGRA